MTEKLEMSISNARCQSHMKASLISAEVETELAEKRTALKAAKEIATAAHRCHDDDSDIVSLKKEINTITERLVRIGGDASVAMAAFADIIVKECLKRAMDQTITAGHKMVEIGALHAGDLSSIGVWPLICDLDSVKKYDPEHEAALRQQRAATNKAQKAAREAKRAKEPDDGADSDSAEARADEDENASLRSPATTFQTYVNNATNVVKQEDAYSSMRVSQRTRIVISDIITEFVVRFSRVAKICILDLLGVRTLTAGHLLAIVKSVYVLKSGTADDPGTQAILDYAAMKVKCYHDHLEAEAARKWKEMDPAKKAEIEAKRAAAAAAKKKQTAENVKKKAVQMVQLAKKLAVETEA